MNLACSTPFPGELSGKMMKMREMRMTRDDTGSSLVRRDCSECGLAYNALVSESDAPVQCPDCGVWNSA